jgi:hypothetical protein
MKSYKCTKCGNSFTAPIKPPKCGCHIGGSEYKGDYKGICGGELVITTGGFIPLVLDAIDLEDSNYPDDDKAYPLARNDKYQALISLNEFAEKYLKIKQGDKTVSFSDMDLAKLKEIQQKMDEGLEMQIIRGRGSRSWDWVKRKPILRPLDDAQLELLEEYTQFLLREQYCDSDVVSELPSAVDQFVEFKRTK